MSFPVQLPKTEPVLTITHPNPQSWVIELHHGSDNRLSERLLREALAPALDIVENDWRQSSAAARKAGDKQAGAGSLVIVGKRGQDKFFSNGFPYEDVLKKPWYIQSFYNPILSRLLSFPIPTVCAMNGHTFAAGFILALACDYRVVTSGKAWASMNEIHFGAPLPRSFTALVNAKSPSTIVTRKIFLEGHRFVPKELLDAGLVDELVEGGTEKVLEAALALGAKWAPHAKTNVWGVQKREIYKQVLDVIQDKPSQMVPQEEADLFADTLRARL